MKKSRVATIAVVAILVVFAFGARAMLHSRAQRMRQQQYDVGLRRYSTALKLGSTRQEVEQYLRSERQPFQQVCCVSATGDVRRTWTDLIQIGSEKPPMYCSKKHVYVALEFEPSKASMTVREPDDSDKLAKVVLFPRLEECL